MNARKITIKDMFQVLFRREFYLDMLVFVFVCIPAVLLVLFLSIKVDNYFGFRPYMAFPYNILCFIILSTAGAIIIWRSYTYLVIMGEGSPCPQLGGTNKLVTCGPYSLIRHPSVIGKLFGIIGLGFLSKSIIFTFIVIPILFFWSMFYNRFIQENGCVERFGKDYLEYRKKVPMFIPRLIKNKSK